MNGTKGRFEVSFPLSISVDPRTLREQARQPTEETANVLVYTHKPRYQNIDVTLRKGERTKAKQSLNWTANYNEALSTSVREQKKSTKSPNSHRKLNLDSICKTDRLSSDACKSDIRTIRAFDDAFLNEIFSVHSERDQLKSFSLGENLNRAGYEKIKRDSVHVAQTGDSPVILKGKVYHPFGENEGSKSEPSRLRAKQGRSGVISGGIDFTRSAYRYTRSWKKRHKLLSKCATDDEPTCLGDHHVPIRTLPNETAAAAASACTARNVLECLRPMNLETEKMKFFARDYDYNPQFKYVKPLSVDFLAQFKQPSVKYLQPALTIMRNLIKRYGSYERYEELTGGRVLQPQEIRALVTDYVQREGFDDGEILLNLSTTILSSAMMSRTGQHGILTVKLGEVHESWIEGMLRHELSTHYIRGKNNSRQPWSSRKNRDQYCLLPHNPTEEGLASLHTVLMRAEPLLFRNALLYYAIVMGATLSFKDLFKKLAEYVLDPERRWDYCVRAKRGQMDTSIPGCFTKDQVYLTGSLNILRNRKRIDFEALMRCGKVAWEDVDRVKGVADYEHTRIPSFMTNMPFYRSRLDFILKTNGLRDADFKHLKSSSSKMGDLNDRVDECRFDI